MQKPWSGVPLSRAHVIALSVLVWSGPTMFILVAPGGRGRGGECAAARYVRVRRPGNRPARDAGTESVRRGRACHGTRPPGPGPSLRTGRRRGDGGRPRAGKLLAAPIRGLERFYPLQPRSGVVTFRRTATEGVALPLPPGDYWHGRPGGRLRDRGQEGAGRYLHRGPGGRQRVRSPGECVG